MLISHKNKFIFIHIPKTAGTTVMNTFLPYARLLDQLVHTNKPVRKLCAITVRLMGWYNDGMKQFTGFHKHATAYEFKDKLGEDLFNSYFKFVFVRNPFDLLVSLYFYISQDKQHPQHELVVNMSFLEFVKWHIKNNNPKNQLHFITDPNSGKRIVDYIGKFETLEKDIDIIQNKLSLEIKSPIKHSNPSVKRKNKSYKEHYDIECRTLVEEYFRDDLDNLGYDFDGLV